MDKPAEWCSKEAELKLEVEKVIIERLEYALEVFRKEGLVPEYSDLNF